MSEFCYYDIKCVANGLFFSAKICGDVYRKVICPVIKCKDVVIVSNDVMFAGMDFGVK